MKRRREEKTFRRFLRSPHLTQSQVNCVRIRKEGEKFESEKDDDDDVRTRFLGGVRMVQEKEKTEAKRPCRRSCGGKWRKGRGWGVSWRLSHWRRLNFSICATRQRHSNFFLLRLTARWTSVHSASYQKLFFLYKTVLSRPQHDTTQRAISHFFRLLFRVRNVCKKPPSNA